MMYPNNTRGSGAGARNPMPRKKKAAVHDALYAKPRPKPTKLGPRKGTGTCTGMRKKMG